MNTILIATNFSKAAKNAMEYGISIAEKMHANIILFHACKNHPDTKACQDEINSECNEITKKYKLNSKGVISDGFTNEEIIKAAIKVNADIIVMGITEASVIEKDILGSMTQKLIKSARIPVLAIPEKARFNPVTKFVWAVGTLVPDITLLGKLAKVAAGFGTQLQIVHVHTDSDKTDSPLTETKELVKKAGYNNILFTTLTGNNVAKELDRYIEKEGASALIIVRKNISFLHDLSSGFAGKMTHITNVPILIINEEEYAIGPLGIKEEEILG